MQPFLAESAPRPLRAIAFAAALAVVASMTMAATMAMTIRRDYLRHHEHHQLPRLGKCVQGYTYLTR